jgi:hypothetical protein
MVGSSNSRHVLNLCVFSQVSFFCRWKMRSITTCQSSIHRYEIDLYSLVDQTKKIFGFILYSFMEFIQHRRVCWMGFRTNPLIYKKVWNTSKNISKLDFFSMSNEITFRFKVSVNLAVFSSWSLFAISSSLTTTTLISF